MDANLVHFVSSLKVWIYGEEEANGHFRLVKRKTHKQIHDTTLNRVAVGT